MSRRDPDYTPSHPGFCGRAGDGDIEGFEASGYLSNHGRGIGHPVVSWDAGAAKISDSLTVLSRRLAVFRRAGNTSALPEFKCETQDGRHVIVL
jgi:hypothetical protein